MKLLKAHANGLLQTNDEQFKFFARHSLGYDASARACVAIDVSSNRRMDAATMRKTLLSMMFDRTRMVAALAALKLVPLRTKSR